MGTEVSHGDVIGAGAGQQGDALEQGDDDEESRQEGLTNYERRWALWLAVMSCFDVVISTSMIVIAALHAVRDNGVSLYCLCIQSFSHALSSLLLAIRFFSEWRLPQDAPGIGIERGLLKQKRREYLVREQTVSV